MPATISDGTTSTAPAVVDGYSSSRPSNNVIHSIIDRETPEVTLRAAGLRTGTLRLVYGSLDDVLAAEELHADGVVLTLTSDELPALGMDYVVAAGVLEVEQDTSRSAWLLRVPFQEVASA